MRTQRRLDQSEQNRATPREHAGRAHTILARMSATDLANLERSPSTHRRQDANLESESPLPLSMLSLEARLTAEATQKSITFIKGAETYSDELNGPSQRSTLELVQNDFNEVLSSKNLTFLFGSGCSSLISPDGEECGIPTMGPLAQGILGQDSTNTAEAYGLTDEHSSILRDVLGLDLASNDYAWNLERLMEVLFGFQFALARSERPELVSALKSVDVAINAVKRYVFDACKDGQTGALSSEVSSIYQAFYRKLSQRSRSLPRPTVATTNYDLFNEIAMDRSGTPYMNGFLGSVEKRFNPASYRYTLAQRLDIASQRWTSIDNLVYFLKLHGSLNWHAVETGLFPVEERPLSESGGGEAMLIYPTPAKQNASFAAPYSDMFREFQSRTVQEQSALVTVGYSFGDEHVNNIIYQALTIPTFRLVVLARPEDSDKVRNAQLKALQNLRDPRIWIIGTDDPESGWKAHYFKYFVEDIMPSGEDDPAEDAIQNAVRLFSGLGKGAEDVDE